MVSNPLPLYSRDAASLLAMPVYMVFCDGGPHHGRTIGLGEVLKGQAIRFTLGSQATIDGSYVPSGTTDDEGRWLFTWRVLKSAQHA